MFVYLAMFGTETRDHLRLAGLRGGRIRIEKRP